MTVMHLAWRGPSPCSPGSYFRNVENKQRASGSVHPAYSLYHRTALQNCDTPRHLFVSERLHDGRVLVPRLDLHSEIAGSQAGATLKYCLAVSTATVGLEI